MTSTPVARLRELFETLTPASVARLPECYAPDARFKDPFNEVQGHAAIVHIFEHMYRQLDEPRFVVHEALGDATQAFITWDMHFRFKGKPAPQVIRGATHLRFGPDGRVILHRDYWDAAEELYEKLPVLGGLMRWIKRRAAG